MDLPVKIFYIYYGIIKINAFLFRRITVKKSRVQRGVKQSTDH